MTAPIAAALADPGRRVLVVCGTGGVGKTSVAASLALAAADAGRHVVLLTIDPARRLATALGMGALGAEPEPVAGVTSSGSLDALMLDMTATFDAAIRSHAAPEQAENLLRNPFYRAISTSFSGTQDYMATEKLGQLHSEAVSTGRWDLIVVDTPPSRSALDFLDAPGRLTELAEGPMLQALVPQSGPLRLINAGLSQATRVVSKIIGSDALTELQTFASAFAQVVGGFKRRADSVGSLLASPEAGFVVVATPRRSALTEARFFADRLARDAMPSVGLIVNMMAAPTPPPGHELEGEALSWWTWRRDRRAGQEATVAELAEMGLPLQFVPELDREVTDRAALRTLAAWVTSAGTAEQDLRPGVDI